MRAVAYQHSLPIDDPLSLQDVDLPDPEPGPRDLLVEVRAVAVNPVDTKQRKRAEPRDGGWAVLGYDAVGVVRGAGDAVTMFAPGDRVWYAGTIGRPGCDSELHVVDERIVARAPGSLDDAAAAALPLTSITAYELLFDRVGVPRRSAGVPPSAAPRAAGTPPEPSAESAGTTPEDPVDSAGTGRRVPAGSATSPGERAGSSGTLLVIGAAGGVGSILVQLARQLTDLTVVATASRSETAAWVRDLGAHEVLDHSRPLSEELTASGLPAPEFVISLNHTDRHFDQIAQLIAPQGRFGLIDDPAPGSIEVLRLKGKSVSLHWESMFTRSVFQTSDMIRQHDLLTEVAALVDAGTVRTTLAEHYGSITAANLRRAHATLESGRSRGKIVLSGF